MRKRVARVAIALIAGTVSAASFVRDPGRAGHARGLGWQLARPAFAQSDGELAAARKLFAEALVDENAKRYDAALEKFKRVQAVRDTQAVRYRIATCLEALGKLRAALAAYASSSIAAATDAESTKIARASREKADALSQRVGRLVVTLSPHAPDDAVVRIDGEPIQANAIGTPIVIDPGPHEITATGTTATPFRTQVTVAEGSQATIDVPLDAAAPPPAPVPTPPPPVNLPPAPVPEPASPAPPSTTRNTVAVVDLTAGGILLGGAVALLVIRSAEISAISGACPAGVCPRDREADITATRNRALIEGPVAIGVGVAGLVAAGIGVYLLATPTEPTTSAFVPWIDRGGGGVAWAKRF